MIVTSGKQGSYSIEKKKVEFVKSLNKNGGVFDTDQTYGFGTNFYDTGLGKTLIQLSLAYNVVLHTNERVLILTPVAVAFQFIIEAKKIGIDDIEYSKDGKFTKKIVICNYERLHLFDPSDFSGIILDERERLIVATLLSVLLLLLLLRSTFLVKS